MRTFALAVTDAYETSSVNIPVIVAPQDGDMHKAPIRCMCIFTIIATFLLCYLIQKVLKLSKTRMRDDAHNIAHLVVHSRLII